MKFHMPLAFLLAALSCCAVLADPSPEETTDQAKPLAGTRHEFQIDGHNAFLIVPEQAAPGRPWLWYAPTFIPRLPGKELDWLIAQLLERGFHIAGVDVGESFGSPAGVEIYQQLYLHLTEEVGLNRQACLLPQSRGGLMLYNWASRHADAVRCIAGIYTVCDLESYPSLKKACAAYGMTPAELLHHLHEFNPIDLLQPLVDADVPVLHIHGDADTVVPLTANSAKLINRYQILGGRAQLIVVPELGHKPVPEFFQRREVLDFILGNGLPTPPEP